MARRDRSGTEVVLLAALTTLLLTGTSQGRAGGFPSAGAASDSGSIPKSGFYCLWKGAGFGHESFEQAAWIVRAPDGTTALIPWPSLRAFRRAAWRGPIPSGALASVHTHPDREGPLPSPLDEDVAARVGLPVVVVSRTGIFAAEPNGTTTVWADADWYRGAGSGGATCRP